MPSIIFNTNRNHLDIAAQGKRLPSIKEFLSIGLTFSLTVFVWIFFRSADLDDAISYISGIFSVSLFTMPTIIPKMLILLLGIFILIEWLGREQQYAIANWGFRWPKAIRWATYYAMVFAICYFAGSEQQFIYFQF